MDGQEFFVNAGLISRHSKSLDSLMNGGWEETGEGAAELKGVSAANFDRFLEWAHRGFYTPPQYSMDPKIDEDLTSDESEEDFAHDSRNEAKTVETLNYRCSNCEYNGNQCFSCCSPLVNENNPRNGVHSQNAMKETFIEAITPINRDVIGMLPPRGNHNKSENYSTIFLCHAELYVFADCRGIQPLRILALEQLHATLAIFTLYKERTDDIVKLLQYIYDNTKADNDDMRSLLEKYLAFEMDTLITDREFLQLIIDDGGPLLGDLMKMVSKRIEAAT